MTWISIFGHMKPKLFFTICKKTDLDIPKEICLLSCRPIRFEDIKNKKSPTEKLRWGLNKREIV